VSLSPSIGIPETNSRRGKRSNQDRPIDSSHHTVAILRDQNADRQQVITQLINSCGGITREFHDSEVNRLEYSHRQSVALVALGNCSFENAETFSVIRELKLKGLKVIAYEDDLFSWQIGTRCRALLSGSSLLLDSAGKTFSDELRQALLNAWKNETERHCEEDRIKEKMNELGFVGVSSKIISVFRWVVRVSALSDFPVLIQGETGTGKELIANALYRLDGKRSKGPFVAANCGAISAGLAESELFGHRRGAFTGADTDRKGLFRSAEGGVLFLDEIGELSQSLQAKLLRVLQEDRVLGVGFDRETPVDVRVIAATNKNLEAMVVEGSFREDLYHRLNGLSVNVPPLRERPEDLRPLTEHFVERYSALSGGASRPVSSEFLEALGQVKLSGNVRQLENIVRRALLSVTNNSPLSLGDLTPTEWEQLSDEVLPANNHNRAGNSYGEIDNQKTEPVDRQPSFLSILNLNGWNLSKSLEYCERSLLKCALQLSQGNQSQTARLIGITPRSVYNKIQRHKLTT